MAAGVSADAGSFGRTVVYLVRHGQTPLNESGVLRVWLIRRWMRPGAARLRGWGPRWGPGDWPPFSLVRWCGHGRPPSRWPNEPGWTWPSISACSTRSLNAKATG